MTVHQLKTWPGFFEAVADGSKTFELRRNDRDYQVGDMLQLRYFDPQTGTYDETRDRVLRVVTYVTDWPAALRPGFVALGIREATKEELIEAMRAVDAGRLTS